MNEVSNSKDKTILSQFTIEELIEEIESREGTAMVYIVSDDSVAVGNPDDKSFEVDSLTGIFTEGAVVYLPHLGGVLRIKDARYMTASSQVPC